MPEKIQLDTASGPALAYHHPATVDVIADLLWMPALGMPAGYYGKFADVLADRGFNVLNYEQPGHGDHPIKPGRKTDYGIRKWLVDDLPVLLDRFRTKQDRPLIIGGHSLGAHVGCCFLGLHPDAAAGFVSIAAAIPYPHHFAPGINWQIRLLSRVIIPATTTLLGYYPGNRIGFGGRESRSLMREWNMMAKTNRYTVPGDDTDIEANLAKLEIPVLQVHMEHDSFAPPRGADSVTDKYKNARITKKKITAAELNDKADHNRWARQADVAAGLVKAWWS